MDRVRADFVRAAAWPPRRASTSSSSTAPTGYLMSSFLSPLTNQRKDEYGGSIDNRAAIRLEVFEAMRAVAGRQADVGASSCHDWFPAATPPTIAVEDRAALQDAGADIIDCLGPGAEGRKTGVRRMFPTLFSDRIRNEVGIPDHRVVAPSSRPTMNSIIGAGRADLCAVACPHLGRPGLDPARGGEDRLSEVSYRSSTFRPCQHD